jgi:hypothetical protein
MSAKNTLFEIKTREEIMEMVNSAEGTTAEKALVGYTYVTEEFNRILEVNKAILKENRELTTTAKTFRWRDSVHPIIKAYTDTLKAIRETAEYVQAANDLGEEYPYKQEDQELLKQECTYLIQRVNTLNAIKQVNALKQELYPLLSEEYKAYLKLKNITALENSSFNIVGFR